MEHQVIISGAGPVGCWLACELQLAGVQTLLIEQTATISPQSRALTIHPRTIEVFAMRGAHHEMLAQAVRIPSGHFAVFEHRLDFKQLDTRFDYTLAIPQARITAILQERDCVSWNRCHGLGLAGRRHADRPARGRHDW